MGQRGGAKWDGRAGEAHGRQTNRFDFDALSTLLLLLVLLAMLLMLLLLMLLLLLFWLVLVSVWSLNAAH